MFKKYKKCFGLLLCCWLVNACGEGNSYSLPRTVKKAEPDSVLVSVDSVNYQHDWELTYTLIDMRNNQTFGGGIVGVLEGPGGKNCCIGLPRKWRPGMKVRVEWEQGDKVQILPKKSVELEIPAYKTPGDLYVLFHPKQEVELVVSSIEPGWPGWPGKEKQPAFAACVARLSEKECRKYLPKYKHGTADYVAAMMRDSCNSEAINQFAKDYSEYRAAEGVKICEGYRRECIETWAVSDKKMCEFDYKEY